MGTKIEVKFVLDLLAQRSKELKDAANREAVTYTKTNDSKHRNEYMQFEYGANILQAVAMDIDDYLVGR